MEPLLSICIPTYNRRAYLENTVAALAPILARAPVEIVLSDDASSDDTGAFLDELAAREPRARVFRQPTRLGGFANTLFALRAARGRFTVYNADDDRLVADVLLETVDFLDRHPDYSAVYAPVEGFDLATNQSSGLALHTPQDVDFDARRRVELVAYICLGLTPEHAVYRTASLAGVMPDPQVYWSLSLLDAVLREGRIRFSPKAFYRATHSHWPGERRPQLYETLMADTLAWESFRLGLELIAVEQPGLLAQPERVAQVRALIDQSIGKRQSVALDFLATQGRWVEYVHAYRMLALRAALPRVFSEAELLRASLNAVAAVLADDRALHAGARVALVGLGARAAGLADALGARGLSVVAAADEAALLVVADAAMLEQAVARGRPRHTIRDFGVLYAAYDLTWLRAHG